MGPDPNVLVLPQTFKLGAVHLMLKGHSRRERELRAAAVQGIITDREEKGAILKWIMHIMDMARSSC